MFPGVCYSVHSYKYFRYFSCHHLHSKQKQAANNTHQIVTYQTLTQDARSHSGIAEESSHLEHDAMSNGKQLKAFRRSSLPSIVILRLKTKVKISSETSLTRNQSTRRHISDLHINSPPPQLSHYTLHTATQNV